MKKPKIDPDEFLTELNAAVLANYSEIDRYREFRQVLLGNEAGKRVLRQILSWGHMWQTSFDANPQVAAFCEGERGLALKIMAHLHIEPKEKPTRQNVKKETNG